MKKIILTLLAFYSIGMSHQITYTFEDVFSPARHVAGLHFKVENTEDQTRKVRIGYQFFGLEGGAGRSRCVSKGIRGLGCKIEGERF